jgi:succinylglutamic semialdehyde dehydrogenase
MMLFRNAIAADLDAIFQLAKHSGIGMTTLPKNKTLLKKRLMWSTNSFKKKVEAPGDEYYLFVLEDTLTQKIVGVSAIDARIGYNTPFYSYKITKRTRVCKSLKQHNDFELLRLVTAHQGCTEICGLFLDESYRHHMNGTLLSKGRFHFMANHPKHFATTVIADMRGVASADGVSPFWEHVGRHFFHMSFAAADKLTLETNKQYIADLMPRSPIYIELLPKAAQEVIGMPHEATVPALKILTKEGFKCDNYVDIFDAGPTLEAPFAEIASIKHSLLLVISSISDEVSSQTYLISNMQRNIHATIGMALHNPQNNTCIINKQTADVLQVGMGDTLRVTLCSGGEMNKKGMDVARAYGKPLESINPADGAVVWSGHAASLNDIHLAYNTARIALPSWANLPFSERALYIKAFANQVQACRAELAHLIALETGKPLWEAQTEVTSVIGKVDLSIEAYQERTHPKKTQTPEAYACLRFKPHGVVAVLGAFNFPAHLSNGHIIPALLAGNTLLYKPSEYAPAVAELIMSCWHTAGIPPGVISCIQGGLEVGKALLQEDIQGVYFTGSYNTGLAIHQQFSDRPEVILALEMGGNNPLVIDTLDDINAAVYQTIVSTMMSAGQRCTCARRLIIPKSAQGDAFLTQYIQACRMLHIGSYHETPEPFMGPVISYQQALKLCHVQKQLTHMGGSSLLTLSLLKENTGFVTPGIIDMTNTIAPDKEYFGPFVQVYRYAHFDEAIDLANSTRYGLSAGLLGNNEAHYLKFYQSVRAGLINWNRPTTGALSSLPFGGVGISGNHRASAYFAADYCAYPIASLEAVELSLPDSLLPGITMEKFT